VTTNFPLLLIGGSQTVSLPAGGTASVPLSNATGNAANQIIGFGGLDRVAPSGASLKIVFKLTVDGLHRGTGTLGQPVFQVLDAAGQVIATALYDPLLQRAETSINRFDAASVVVSGGGEAGTARVSSQFAFFDDHGEAGNALTLAPGLRVARKPSRSSAVSSVPATLQAGQTYTIAVAATAPSPSAPRIEALPFNEVTLLPLTMPPLAASTGANGSASLVFTPTTTGSYLFRASDGLGATGGYVVGLSGEGQNAAGGPRLGGRLGADGADVILAAGFSGDVIEGQGGDDLLVGQPASDTLLGDIGRDALFGREGGDRLDGGAGDDNLFGEAGDDTLLAGAGIDNLTGGPGADFLVVGEGRGAHDGVFGFNAAEGDRLLWQRLVGSPIIDAATAAAAQINQGGNSFLWLGHNGVEDVWVILVGVARVDATHLLVAP
jgi:Ca2+-binding RTX toxin-like protein